MNDLYDKLKCDITDKAKRRFFNDLKQIKWN